MGTINIISYYFYLIVTYFWFLVTYMYDQYREFSFVIKVAAISVTICVFIIFYLLFRMMRKSRKRHKVRRIMQDLEKKYGDGIRYIMSEEAPSNMSRDQIIQALNLHESDSTSYASLLKKSKEKLAFCRLVYQERISERAAVGKSKNIQILLNLFELPQYLETVVNNDKMDKKVEAMTMLNAFKLTVSLWLANRMMGSKRNRAKRVASYASIMTNSNNDLEYFESEFFDHNCCKYDEIQLGYILQRRLSSKRAIPNMAHWAHLHPNPDAQCIFIRMMRFFNQREYCSDLEELFLHQADPSVIQEISRTWGYLGYKEAEQNMREMMLTQSDEIKVTIMHALARFNTGESLDAIVDIYLHSGSQRVRYEALRSLYNYGAVGRAKFEELRLKAVEEGDKKLFEFFVNTMSLEDVKLPKNDFYEQMYGDNFYSVS